MKPQGTIRLVYFLKSDSHPFPTINMDLVPETSTLKWLVQLDDSKPLLRNGWKSQQVCT